MRLAPCVLLAACAGTTAPVATTPRTLRPEVQLVERKWPIEMLISVGAPTPRPYFASPIIVVPHLGPAQGPPPKEDVATLERAAATARGTARLVALDRLSDALEDHVTDDPDHYEDDQKHLAETCRALVAAPGFAKYANDALLFRTARLLFNAGDAASARDVAQQLITRWPKSPLLGDVYVLLGNEAGRDQPDVARNYYELAQPLVRPALSAYVHMQHADVLTVLEHYDEALAELQIVATAEPAWRSAVVALAEHAYVKVGSPHDATEYFDKLDPHHDTGGSLRLVDDYLDDNRDDDAAIVIGELFARSTDPEELCWAHVANLSLKRHVGTHADVVAEARSLVAMSSDREACRRGADEQFVELAQTWHADPENADRMWRLVLEVTTDPDRRAIALRARAIAAWTLAANSRRMDAASWRAAATALDAAYDANPKQADLHAGAEDARRNAAAVEHR